MCGICIQLYTNPPTTKAFLRPQVAAALLLVLLVLLLLLLLAHLLPLLLLLPGVLARSFFARPFGSAAGGNSGSTSGSASAALQGGRLDYIFLHEDLVEGGLLQAAEQHPRVS